MFYSVPQNFPDLFTSTVQRRLWLRLSKWPQVHYLCSIFVLTPPFHCKFSNAVTKIDTKSNFGKIANFKATWFSAARLAGQLIALGKLNHWFHGDSIVEELWDTLIVGGNAFMSGFLQSPLLSDPGNRQVKKNLSVTLNSALLDFDFCSFFTIGFAKIFWETFPKLFCVFW